MNAIEDDDAIKALLKSADTPKRTAKKPNYDISERSVTAWFKLPTKLSVCSNPKCQDPRVHDRNPYGKRTFVLNVPDVAAMCRYCYIEGFAAEAAEVTPGLDIPAEGV